MPLAGWTEVVLDSKVQLDTTRPEPGASASDESGGLVDLHHPEGFGVERSCRLLLSARHR